MKPLFCLPWGYLIGQLLLASNVLAEPPPQTPFTQSETTTTETLTETARRWGLSVEEYHRYTEIMRGPLGRWNPEMDPVMALGILAENEQERQRYAEYFAQREYALTVKTLAFERAYRAAFRRLFPEAEIVDTQALQPFYNHQQQHQQKQQQDQAVVYVGLDALTDPEVAEVVGESAFSDLTSLSGRLYKHGAEGGLPKLASNTHSENPIPTHTQKPRILIHADEFSDLIGPQFKTFINKSGGAGFELTLYTQTWSDPIAELGDAAKAGQLAGNIGTQIMMGVKEINTCEMLTRQLPEVTVSEVMSITSATDASNLEDGITFVSQNQDRISVTRVPMIAPADIVALPKGQAFVLLNGSELWKIRIPLPSPADEQSLPDDLGTMLQAMREEYTTVTDWQSYKQAYGTTTDKAT